MKKLILIAVFSIFGQFMLHAQVIFVDAIKGTAEGKGTVTDPLSSLEKAVALAGTFRGKEAITIKVAPGLYKLQHDLEVRSGNQPDDVSYTIEATLLPDHPDWVPDKMPVIQSISDNNSTTQFVHCVGLIIAKNNVTVRGLKFVGNPNPKVVYYYPITRENERYKNLDISQCYFIGEKNSSAIQGAVYAHGAGIHVDHCIFFGCKNALLLFNSISDFSVTHSIISGAYESAVWFGPYRSPFVFQNNIITECTYVWLRPEKTNPAYKFENSLITGNDNYMGFYGSMGPMTAPTDSLVEKGVQKTGKVLLVEVETHGIPKDYLNLTRESDGKDLGAGIYKNMKK